VAQAFFRSRLARSWVPGYLADRGFPRRQSSSSGRLATLPHPGDALTRHLRTLGFADQLLEAAGLARRSRRGNPQSTPFRNRAHASHPRRPTEP